MNHNSLIDDLPAAFGHCIFSDDIRDEVGGKKSYIGVYASTMYIHEPFPIVVPKFGISIMLSQKREAFDPNVTFHVYMPESSETPAIVVEAQEQKPGAALAMAAQSTAPNDTGKPSSPLVQILNGFVLSPLELKNEGDIIVTAIVNGKTIRLGRLRVRLSKQGIEMTAAAKAHVSK